jgi:hypothetical protein
MPIFVGSNSDDSRIRSNRVGFAVSTANPGSASEGDVYFNSSDSGLRAYDGSAWSAVGAGGGTFSGIASGTLANGQTVILHSDGKVGIVTVSGSADPSAGTPVVFESATLYYPSAAYDSANGKVVIAYRDGGNSSYGTAVVGTVSGTSISFGTPVVFKSSSITLVSAVYDSANDKVVLAYQDGASNYYGRAIVGTVSGTSISFGTEATIGGSAVNAGWISAVYDSSNEKVVIAYMNNSNSNYGTAVVATVSGTSISFGTPVVFSSSNAANHLSAAYDSTNGKVVIAYRDMDNSNYGTAVVGTVSGTSISFGSASVFNSTDTRYCSAVYDSANDKVVIAYQKYDSDRYGTAIVGTVSGTSISFGAAVTFESANTTYVSAAYDSSKEKVVIAYSDNGNSSYGTIIVGTVSGTSISFSTPIVFESALVRYIASTFDSTNGKVVTAYQDADNSSYGTAVVVSADNLTTNLTSSNFIGFSDAAYSDGATATIQIAGAVDDAQSGLTTGSLHYVQNDGTLSTTAGNPSVEAGTALSATKIKVKK